MIVVVCPPAHLGSLFGIKSSKSFCRKAEGLHLNPILIHQAKANLRICTLARIGELFFPLCRGGPLLRIASNFSYHFADGSWDVVTEYVYDHLHPPFYRNVSRPAM